MINAVRTAKSKARKGAWPAHVASDGLKEDGEAVANAERLMPGVSKSLGSVTGVFKRLSIHERHEFTVYPTIGLPVVCRFDPAILEDAKSAFGKRVTVHGLLTYFEGQKFPELVEVQRIEIMKPDSELPRFSDLRGMLKDPLKPIRVKARVDA